MDQAELRALEDRCVQDCPPSCTAACPAHLDVRGMMSAVADGRLAEALALVRAAVTLPVAVALTCDQPCRPVCLRGEHGDALMVRAIERACVALPATAPRGRRPPQRRGSVAVVGGGLTGIAAAQELAGKGCRVTLLERTGRLGGGVWSALPQASGTVVVAGAAGSPAAAVEAELAAAVSDVTVSYAEAITAGDLPALRAAHDAVILAFGVDDPGCLATALGSTGPERVSGATEIPGVFAGGSLTRASSGWSAVTSMADGRSLAVSVRRYLEGVSLTAGREGEGAGRSCLHVERSAVESAAAAPPADPQAGYDATEARREAGRCLQCACLECVKACVFLQRYGSYPKQYVRQINNSLILSPGMGYRASKTMIDSCALCGLCAAVCPHDLNMGEVCLDARRELVEKGYMPPAVHDFALHDMAQANGADFSCARHQPGAAASAFAFYPGCQLPASRPGRVRAAYEHLASRLDGGVGLLLGCCGAPAQWAGRESLAAEATAQLRASWETLGRPQLILACPSCQKTLMESAPEIPAVSLWEVLDEVGLPSGCGAAAVAVGGSPVVAVADPCAARDTPAVRAAARHLIARAGFELVELPWSGARTECCGWGGLQVIVDRQLTQATVARRVAEDPHDYVAYCAMCRDLFAGSGKRAWHLVDLLFGGPMAGDPALPGPRLTERQQARARFRRDLLRNAWGEDGDPRAQDDSTQLEISDEMRQKMDDELIGEDDLAAVIAASERSGRRLLDSATGHCLGHARRRLVTLWVEYSPLGQGRFAIHDTYTHRIEILDDEATEGRVGP